MPLWQAAPPRGAAAGGLGEAIGLWGAVVSWAEAADESASSAAGTISNPRNKNVINATGAGKEGALFKQ
jgi:hypothetical protein